MAQLIDDLFGLLSAIAVIVLIIVAVRQNARIGLMQRELGALRSLVLSFVPGPNARPTAVATAGTARAVPVRARLQAAVDSEIVATEVEPADAEALIVPEERPTDTVTPRPAADVMPAAEMPGVPMRPSLETALGTRWAVWVGGVALALGGIFLVRYTIEAGLFGPAMRLTLAALFGIALMVAGEFIRRADFQMSAAGAAGAYIPAVLTAAGAFTLFGSVYAAHALYDFIGPATAFVLLGIVGLGTIALALIHGQALAGVGLLGSLATPILVSSQTLNVWALFGYLAIVLVATVAISRIRRWRFLASAAFVGTGLWTFFYIADAAVVGLNPILFMSVVTLAVIGIVWAGGRGLYQQARAHAFPSAVPAFFVAFTALVLMIDLDLRLPGGVIAGACLLAAMVAVAALLVETLPLAFGAAAATVFIAFRIAFVGTFTFEALGKPVTIEGFDVGPDAAGLIYAESILGLLFLATGLWRARELVVRSARSAASWACLAGVVPLVVVVGFCLALGNPDRDFGYAAAAVVLALILVAGAEWVARREQPPMSGTSAVSFLMAFAGLAWLFAIEMAFSSGWTSVLVGASAALPALATRLRRYPILGWLAVGVAVMMLARVAIDPTIVGAAQLSTTPVFNWLLLGYGIPALGFAFAAWQLSRTTAGRPMLVMQAAAALFALLTVAMLVRHAMNGGVIYGGRPSLAEQAIYSLIALGASGILIALDTRSPSSVFRWGSIGIGVVSVAMIALQHFGFLNPYLTDEATGQIPVFNLLLLAYLLPAIAATGLALYSRGRRPDWYRRGMSLLAALLAFTYATLSVRRIFKGEHLAYWYGFEPLETYTYSALWLGLGVVLLVIGVRTRSLVLRLASGVLIAIAVVKVFLIDMSNLEGVLRAFSFIGLGVVLIGIGLFYQRLLTRAAGPASMPTPPAQAAAGGPAAP